VIALGPPEEAPPVSTDEVPAAGVAAPTGWAEPPVERAPPPEPDLATPATEPSGETVAAATDGDDLGRAEALLDELRGLLPRLAAPPVGSGVAVEGVAAALAEVRDDAVSNSGRFDALIAVVATATERPRDIDVMLDLARQVNAISDLKASYDRSLAAIDDAVTRLRQG
jgi:hypothetical protein